VWTHGLRSGRGTESTRHEPDRRRLRFNQVWFAKNAPRVDCRDRFLSRCVEPVSWQHPRRLTRFRAKFATASTPGSNECPCPKATATTYEEFQRKHANRFAKHTSVPIRERSECCGRRIFIQSVEPAVQSTITSSKAPSPTELEIAWSPLRPPATVPPLSMHESGWREPEVQRVIEKSIGRSRGPPNTAAQIFYWANTLRQCNTSRNAMAESCPNEIESPFFVRVEE